MNVEKIVSLKQPKTFVSIKTWTNVAKIVGFL